MCETCGNTTPAGTPHSDGTQFSGEQIQVYNNKITNVQGQHIFYTGVFGTTGSTVQDIYIYNNVLAVTDEDWALQLAPRE